MITGLSHILAYREQQQLFLFDSAYIAGAFFKVGGLSTLVGRFIVQFFWSPALACILTALLLALSAFVFWLAFRRSASDWSLAPLCIAPVLLMGACLCDNAIHFDVLISWILCISALAVYRSIKSCRVGWGALITIILYLAAGPAAMVFAVTAFISDCFRSRFASALNLLVALACALAAYGLAWVPTMKAALTPSLFYDLDATMPFAHWAPWIAIPILAVIVENLEVLHLKKSRILLLTCALLVAAAPVSIGIANKFYQKQSATLYEFEYYTVNEDWDGLIKCCKKQEWMPITANYLNMALSYQGKLCDDLFKYDQRGPMSLIMTHKDRGVDVTQAHIMFAMGNIAAAQDVSFNLLLSLNGLCPAMLKMNALIEMMRGADEVADKYLTILEKAPHYRKWARQQRQSPDIGSRRNSFPDSGFSMFGDPMTELYNVLECNSVDKQAMQYALSFLMLAKDMNSICQIVNRFYGSPALQELPATVQEAVLFQSEYLRNVENINTLDEVWCLEHGVTHETIRRFEAFKQASLQNGGKAPARFRGTFWYYLTAVQI